MKLMVLSDEDKAIDYAANLVAKRICDYNPGPNKPFIIGLPASHAAIPFYKALVKVYQKKKLTFQYLTVFALYSYVGVPSFSKDSVESFLWRNLFKYVDIHPKNIYMIKGNSEDLKKECQCFEHIVKEFGPMHLFISDVSPEGNIGFNDKGSSLTGITKVKPLNSKMRLSLVPLFGDLDHVPNSVICIGVGTIMTSDEIIFLVIGNKCATTLQAAIEGGFSQMNTFSMFQQHPRVIVVCDAEATQELKVKTVQYYKELRPVLELYDF